jgi:L-aspartate oxidase
MRRAAPSPSRRYATGPSLSREGRGLAGQPIVIGAGLAGLMTALHLAPQPVVVLTKASLGAEAASGWAQGGVAAALGADDDAALHVADTLASGDGLCDPAAVARIIGAGAQVIEDLARHGVAFDRDAAGALAFGLEAAHSRRRIVHAGGGDGAGRAILCALVAAAGRTPSITILEQIEARRLLIEDGRVTGVLAVGRMGPLLLASDRVIIASGGSGALYRHTTNPLGAIGQGIALAARAGAALADMEFVQFHPTALDAGFDPMPLVSEAVRGEGAVLVDETGRRFMAGQGRAELEPRDVVARAVWRHLSAGHRVFLDARALGARFAAHFPIIAATCAKADIDPALEPIPVRPAAHYLMGGIAVDAAGRSSLAGLWACGEAASTGLHGANRLASNSLLEAAATARWVADSIAGTHAETVQARWPIAVPPAADAAAVRDILSAHLGVLRDRDGLRQAVAALAPLAAGSSAAADPACVGLLIAVAALKREESRGSHSRSDFPAHAPHWGRRQTLRLAEAEAVARELLTTPFPMSRRA